MLMPPRKKARNNGSASSSASGDGNNRGRPMKRPSQLKASRKVRTQQAALLHQQQTRSKAPAALARLERLPTEILEQIFFHCLELNLPRASARLGGTLASPRTYSALVLLAFYESIPIAHPNPQLFLPATFRYLELDERIRLQHEILCSKWCTFDALQSCMPTLTRLQMSQWLLQEIQDVQDRSDKGLHVWEQQRQLNDAWTQEQDLLMGDANPENIQGPDVVIGEKGPVLPASNDEEALRKHFKAELHTETAPRIVTYDYAKVSSTQAGSPLQPYKPHGRSTLAVHVIPDHLLCGRPWTDAKLRLLRFLRQGVRWLLLPTTIYISPQALFVGVANAIREHNRQALLVLLELHDIVRWALPSTPDPSSGALGIESAPQRPRHPLPAEIFHIACREAADPDLADVFSSDMVALLFCSGVEDIGPNDKILTRWATHAVTVAPVTQVRTENARAARWLLRWMEHVTHPETMCWTDAVYPIHRWVVTSRELGYDCNYAPPDRSHGGPEGMTVLESLL